MTVRIRSTPILSAEIKDGALIAAECLMLPLTVLVIALAGVFVELVAVSFFALIGKLKYFN